MFTESELSAKWLHVNVNERFSGKWFFCDITAKKKRINLYFCKTGARISAPPPPPLERTKGPACESTKLSLAYVTVTSRIPGPPLERTKGPAWQSTKLSLAYVTVTSRTQHTGGSTPCTDGLIISPSPHHLKFTEKSMQCNVYKKVTIHVWYLLKCLSAPGKMVSFSQS